MLGLKEDIGKFRSETGSFLEELAMKNFILQIDNLKNREYDMNQMIEAFKNETNEKFQFKDNQQTTNPSQNMARSFLFKIYESF